MDKGAQGDGTKEQHGGTEGVEGGTEEGWAGGRWPDWPARGVEGSRDPYLEDGAGFRTRVEWGMEGVKGVGLSHHY